jgi:hypothetical protein
MENVEEKTDTPQQTFYTVAEFSQRHSFLTEGGLRFQIFNANENGLTESGAIVRLGRRVLLDEENYFGWIKNQQKGRLG